MRLCSNAVNAFRQIGLHVVNRNYNGNFTVAHTSSAGFSQIVSKFNFKAIFGLKNFLLFVMKRKTPQKQFINFDSSQENGLTPLKKERNESL
jgi:hypothetical protein